jgi:hypothetical protein
MTNAATTADPRIGTHCWTPVGWNDTARIRVIGWADIPGWMRVEDERGVRYVTHQQHVYLTKPAAARRA